MGLPSDQKYLEVMDATSPGKLERLSPQEMQAHYDYLCDLLPGPIFHKGRGNEDSLGPRIEVLRNAMQARRHEQALALGRQTLSWAKIAGIAGVIATTATVALLLKDIPLSKLLPSTPSQPTPRPRPAPQASATVEPSPAPTAAESPQVSETPAVTAAPE